MSDSAFAPVRLAHSATSLGSWAGLFSSVPTWRSLPELKELSERVRTYRPLALPMPTERRALGSS